MRKSGLELKLKELGYPNLISKDTINKLSEKTQPLSDMPYYNKSQEPELWREESIALERYTDLIDSYSRTYDIDKLDITPMKVMMSASVANMIAMDKESNKKKELCLLAEKIIRDEWSLDNTEVIFDLELINHGGIELPEEVSIESPLTEEEKLEVESELSNEIVKRRTINALTQGAALKGHYIFHLYQEDIHEIAPDVVSYYQKALIANDLIYYISDNDAFKSNIEANNNNNAGYVDLDFNGETPKIIVKAINLPILIHEMVKGILSLFSVVGLPNEEPKKIIDYTDTVMNELWDIRLSPVIWTNLNSLFHEDEKDFKKLVLIELFKKDPEEFIKFMGYLEKNTDLARKEVLNIINEKKRDIMEFEFNNSIDDINLSDLGL